MLQIIRKQCYAGRYGPYGRSSVRATVRASESVMSRATRQCHWAVPLRSAIGQWHWEVPLESASGECHWAVSLGSGTGQCHWAVALDSATGTVVKVYNYIFLGGVLRWSPQTSTALKVYRYDLFGRGGAVEPHKLHGSESI